MTRSLNGALLADLSTESAVLVWLVSLQFGAGVTRLTSSAQDIFWNANTWTAAGGALGIEPLMESADLRAQGVRLTLSGVDPAIISTVLGADHRGRAALLYLGHLNPTTGVVTGVQKVFAGYMNDGFEVTQEQPEVDGAPGTVRVTTRIVSRLVDLDRVRGISANVASHQAHFSADTFFANVAPLMGRVIYFGPSRVNIPVGPGFMPDLPPYV